MLQAEVLLPPHELLPQLLQFLLCAEQHVLCTGPELLCTGPELLRTGRHHDRTGSTRDGSDAGRTGSCSLKPHSVSSSDDRALFDHEDGPVFFCALA